ncbi:response regulator [Paenibacillus sp. F411]|uniref:Two component transcriptional regulator, AraC family n=1 Tax=Paenibacillus algicola TaxID=2565926 RepID=A0A4P8XM30_9BACL|nr:MULTISPECIES: response regulator [Paenibacillus]MBO2942683.1 response regulator [Paenibacillus sp. F411]QCT03375.1 two component transcriptional regulator, AraC family [Paenibacillus algicola]
MYRVLIVDDEPMIRQSLSVLISERKDLIVDVKTAENGAAALGILEEGLPDFIFTDIRMPKMNGIELCRHLFQQDSSVQIAVVSGYGDFEYAQQCMSLGVKEYLLKPVSRDKVHHVLEKMAAAARKKKKSTYISPVRLEEVAHAMEQAIWSLSKEQLNKLLKDCEQEFMGYGLGEKQQQELLQALYGLVLKKLNARDIYAFQVNTELMFHEGRELYPRLQDALNLFIDQLQSKRRGHVKDPVEESKRYIEAHLARESSLEEVADILGLNPSYFSQMFKQSTGETFVQYRIRRRMERAKKLLQQPHYRITDIAYDIGYADHSHFTKTFKKYTGVSPSEFRQSLGMNG